MKSVDSINLIITGTDNIECLLKVECILTNIKLIDRNVNKNVESFDDSLDRQSETISP